MACVSVCESSGLRRRDCTCRDCEEHRDELAELRRRKSQWTLADRPDRDLYLRVIDAHIRRLERML